MPKAKRSAKKTTRRRARQNKLAKPCTALLVVDQTPFLKKALSKCRRLRTELHKKQALLEDFEERDQVAYQKWFHRSQGGRLAAIRRHEESINAYGFIKHQLEYTAFWNYESLPQVYEELMRRKEAGTLYEFEPTDYSKRDDDLNEPGDDAYQEDDEYEDEFDDEDDAFKKFFDDMFGDGARNRWSFDFDEKPPPEEAVRLKTCYRKLAKRLHPDHSELEEKLRKKRWHEIQEAYHDGDLEALLRVEAVCDMEDTGLTLKLGLARLRDLANYHQSHLKPIRKALQMAKKDIAFGFAKNGPTADLKSEVQAELESKSERLVYVVEEMAEYTQCLYEEACDLLGRRKPEAADAIDKYPAGSEADASASTKADGGPAVDAEGGRTRPRKKRTAQKDDARQMSFF